MAQPTCPTVERLDALIEHYTNSVYVNEEDSTTSDDTINALHWLRNFLLSRRMYHRKVAIKRKIMTKLVAEQGFAQELDDAIKAAYGEELERLEVNEHDDD